jgi:hypothetical protein
MNQKTKILAVGRPRFPSQIVGLIVVADIGIGLFLGMNGFQIVDVLPVCLISLILSVAAPICAWRLAVRRWIVAEHP